MTFNAGATVLSCKMRAWVFGALVAVAVALFAGGFLLTRHATADVSDDTAPWPAGGPWPAASYDRVALVVVDALRWDLVARGLPRVLARRGLVARPFWSDAPTTTSQRLKGLTTGSLPTFIDVSRNFASANVSEDNWLDQAVRHGKRATLLGDDTWTQLYSGRFRRMFAFPSFNTRDLHTVDDGVLRHLLPEFRAGDWDILIAHFLGVDHVGHTHGPAHPVRRVRVGDLIF